MPLVLGLGNPGERYAPTRHNVAWWVLDLLAERGSATELERDPLYRARLASIAGKSLVLLQPLTYMNASGEALARWLEERKASPPSDASDDLIRRSTVPTEDRVPLAESLAAGKPLAPGQAAAPISPAASKRAA